MNRPGYTLPPITFLKNIPAIAQAGSVMATDLRGSGTYVYKLVPNPATTGFADMGLFYRYAIGRDGTPVADSWQQLATPPWGAATETIDSGTSMIVDATDGTVYLVNADNAAGPIYHRFRAYTPATNTWAAFAPVAPNSLEAILGLAAPITNASLVHACSTVSPAIAAAQEAFIYLAVGNSATMAAYSKATGFWSNPLVGAPRGGAPGAGSTLSFVPSEPGRLYGLRGGATATFDRYTLATNAWDNVVLVPATETFTTGAEATTLRDYAETIFVHRSGSVKAINVSTGAVEPIAALMGADGTQHAGSGIVAYRVGTKVLLGIRKHTSAEFQRIELVL